MTSTQATSDTLFGRDIDGYRVERLLGRGGMARVYRGFDAQLHRYVAIKIIDPNVEGQLNYKERFIKEARAIAQLRHSNIVNIYRFGEFEGQYYMVMEYIDGTDLRWVLHDYALKRELIPYNDVLRIISQMAEALDAAHAQGVIHRDVKPSNIMINTKGDAVLTDFGLVLVASEATRGEIFGSPHYIAPEQAISSAKVVPQSDLYGLGVVLYEMLTGQVPFNSGTAMQIAMSHMVEPLPSARSINPNLDPAFVSVLETALAKEPEKRYQTGAELVRALKKATAEAKRTDASDRSRQKGLKLPTPSEPEALHLSSEDVLAKVTRFATENPLPLPGTALPPAPAVPAVRGMPLLQPVAPRRIRGVRVLALLLLVALVAAAALLVRDVAAPAASGSTQTPAAVSAAETTEAAGGAVTVANTPAPAETQPDVQPTPAPTEPALTEPALTEPALTEPAAAVATEVPSTATASPTAPRLTALPSAVPASGENVPLLSTVLEGRISASDCAAGTLQLYDDITVVLPEDDPLLDAACEQELLPRGAFVRIEGSYRLDAAGSFVFVEVSFRTIGGEQYPSPTPTATNTRAP